ncbi:MAG: MoxR family ATPase [Candidatus Eremiobacteraeota bacterium]|nr:MoxR family ATPase [Candidatus Eremiobacteraeota bacterium]
MLVDEVRALIDNVERVILGKRETIEIVVVALLCEGHVLLEDVPGVGKTMLSRAVARSLGCSHARVQCTPDLLPSDLTGVNVYNQKTSDFEFRPGPLHHQIILADEINRATPKTQSALLECMEERQITIDGVTHPLPRPFLVLATQNPVEHEGTFPLPEAQMDRFMVRARLGYPSAEAEKQMLKGQQMAHPVESVSQVLEGARLLELQTEVRQIHVGDNLLDYIVELVRQTRDSADLRLGASPRGSLALFRGAQACAALDGREFVLPDDIQKMALPTLGHRLLSRGDLTGRAGEELIAELVGRVPVPV